MIKILTIANNNSDLQFIVTLLSEAFPFVKLITAYNGKNGNEKAQSENPDLMLLSLKITDEDGFHTWQTVKSDKILSQIPLIIITPSAIITKNKAKLLNLRAESFISTPFEEHELKSQVNAFIQLKKSKEMALVEKNLMEELIAMRTKALQVELESGKEIENQLSNINKELEDHKLATLNLLDDLKTEISERSLAEASLANSEEQLRTLINAMTDFVVFKDGEGCWSVANEFALKIFNLENIDYQGKKDSELAELTVYHKDSLLGCNVTDELAWQNGFPNRHDEIITQPNETSLIFDVIKIPAFTKEGHRKGLVVVGRDITDRKRIEEELTQLSQVVEQSPDSIIVTNTDGIIEYVNPATYKLTGYSREELIGQNPRILRAGSASKEEIDLYLETIKGGNEWKGEYPCRRKNGKLYWVRNSITSLRNDQGTITQFLSINEDITDKKHDETIQRVLFNISKQAIEILDIEQLLEIIKQELHQLVDTNNFFVAFYSEDTGMLTPAYRADENDTMHSWPAEKSLTGYVIKHGKSLLLNREGFQKLVETGEVELVGTAAEVWLGVPLKANGKPFGAIVVQDYINPDAYSESELQMLEFIASQISLSIQRQKSIIELREALGKVEASDVLKTAFINNISHEIRTPLNGILGFSEMMLNHDSTPEDDELCYSVIKKSSKRLLNTVSSYMDISMIVSETMEVSRRPSKIDKLIEEVYSEFRNVCEQKNLELIIKKPSHEEPLVLKTDQDKLHKILNHLLDNALKFTSDGTIVLGYKLNEEEIEFFISDTGTGIKTEVLRIIFDAFMQADISPSRGYEGSGLGLAISKGMIKLLGGKIWVESEWGKGSTFHFTLPFSENPVLTARKEVPAIKTEPQEKPLILIAEDDDSNYKYTEIVLMYASYQVMRAENGFEAIELCRTHPDIRLILMDIKMPLMDGFEATRQIKSFMPDVPIVALTAHVTTEDENEAMAAGCNEYVTKPVSKAKLLEIISYSLTSNN
jgi:PAS domain S-box-containing protein